MNDKPDLASEFLNIIDEEARELRENINKRLRENINKKLRKNINKRLREKGLEPIEWQRLKRKLS